MTVPASPSAFAELEDDLVSGRLTEALADIAEEAARLRRDLTRLKRRRQA